MKRTLWSLLVGAAAVLPAVPGVREAAAAPVSASHSLPDLHPARRSAPRVEPRAEMRRMEAPRMWALLAGRSFQQEPAPAAPPAPLSPTGAPLPPVEHRLPPARAPDALR